MFRQFRCTGDKRSRSLSVSPIRHDRELELQFEVGRSRREEDGSGPGSAGERCDALHGLFGGPDGVRHHAEIDEGGATLL